MLLSATDPPTSLIIIDQVQEGGGTNDAAPAAVHIANVRTNERTSQSRRRWETWKTVIFSEGNEKIPN